MISVDDLVEQYENMKFSGTRDEFDASPLVQEALDFPDEDESYDEDGHLNE